MAEEMVWEQPPKPGHGYDWAEVARTLRSRPGQWLRVFDSGPVSIVNAIRQSSIKALMPIHRPGKDGYGFEVRTTNNKTNGTQRQATLYLRWVPELQVEEQDVAQSGA